MAITDIIVRGAGIFGLSCAWSLARRGARVQVVDPHGIGSGSSGGIVGALSPHVPENWNQKKAFQLESLLMAADYWAEVEGLTGKSAGYARCGRLQPLADDRAVDLAQARAVSATEIWGDAAHWEVTRAPDGWAPNSATGLVIHDTLSGRIHPRMALAALTAALAREGCTVVPETDAAGPTLWATGLAGLADLPNPGVGVKGQAALFDLDMRDHPQIFTDTLHIIPHADGTTAVGSTSERTWTQDEPDDALDDVIERARTAMPVLRQAQVIERWAGIRPRSSTRAPVLGHHPQHTGDFIANGGFKIGFGMAPLVGEVMADLILDGTNRIPQDFVA